LGYEVTYGGFLASPKREAIFRGDVTSGIIDPFFVHFAHLTGCHFYQERLGRYFLLPIRSKHLHLALQALRTMKEEDDPFSFAQANFFIGTAYLYVRAVHVGNRYLKRAIQTIKRNNIRFVSSSRRDYISSEPNPNIDPPLPETESLEIVYERCLLLGELVYIGVVFYMIGQPTVKFDIVLEDYFLSQLPVGSLDSAKGSSVVFFTKTRLPVDDVSRCLHARGPINGNLH
jgi:hypothetical protein